MRRDGPVIVGATVTDLAKLDRAHGDLSRALGMLNLAIACAAFEEIEHRATLLDGAKGALSSALRDVAHVVRALRMRLRAERDKQRRLSRTLTTPVISRTDRSPKWSRKQKPGR